jgi:hypothetical protein
VTRDTPYKSPVEPTAKQLDTLEHATSTTPRPIDAAVGQATTDHAGATQAHPAAPSTTRATRRTLGGCGSQTGTGWGESDPDVCAEAFGP